MSWLRRLLRKEELIFLAVALILGACASAFYVWSRPAMLVVAVAPRDSGEARLLAAYSEALVRERKDVRIRLLPFDEVRQSAEWLASGQADLAIVRPDVLLPENGMTVAVLRQEAVIVLAPEGSKITDLAGLARKRLGIVSRHGADPGIIAQILSEYDLAPSALSVVPLVPDGIEEAFQQKRVDAVALVAAPVGGATAAMIKAAERGAGRTINLIPIGEGDALTLKNPTLVSITIPVGAFGGRPKLPDEEIKTVGVTTG